MRFKVVVALLSLASLVGCGGGGDDPDVADKYAGTWMTCIPHASNTSSSKFQIVNTKAGATSTRFTYTIDFYNSTPNCTGRFLTESSSQGIDNYLGTKSIGADVVDLIETTINKPDGSRERSYKDIGLVSGNKLYYGDFAKPNDAGGYPTSLDKEFYLTKQ
jgi:hypothetical protein